MTAIAAELLGRHLGAGRTGFGDIIEDGLVVRVESDWAGSMGSLAGEARVLDAFGPQIINQLRRGETLVVDHCDEDARVEQGHLQTWRSIGTKALIVAPLLREGALTGILYVHSAQERHWTEAEAVLVREVAARTWSAYRQSQAEAALRRSEARERQRDHDRLWRISQEVMLVRDEAGIILSVNPSAKRLLGWDPQEMIGKSIFEFMHPEDRDRTASYVAHQAASDDVITIQNRYRARDGSYRLFDWRGVVEDGVVHAVGRDITAEHQAAEELRNTEEALRQAQKMEAIGQLTGGIAHDFNNMLAGIIGSLDVIQRRLAAGRYDDIARFIDGAVTSSRRAASLTQRLLAFGRRQALDVQAVEIGQLVRSLHDLLRRTLGEAIDIGIDVPPGEWWARADAAQLESAILNLAINARDAMPDGGVITIALGSRHLPTSGPRLPAGDYLTVSVADNGSGMPPEVMRKAFDPFFTTKPLGQGTGLGLSMIHGFMGQIGGDVTIDSAPGAGTTVTMFLPPAQPSVDEPMPASMAPTSLVHGGTVLVVEDDPAIRMLIGSVLDDFNIKSAFAVDGNAGLAILQSDLRIDLLISDIGLPGMNGQQLVKLAREIRPSLPVLFLTGYAKGAGLNGDELEPGTRLMTKPFELSALAGTIEEMLSAKAPPGH